MNTVKITGSLVLVYIEFVCFYCINIRIYCSMYFQSDRKKIPILCLVSLIYEQEHEYHYVLLRIQLPLSFHQTQQHLYFCHILMKLLHLKKQGCLIGFAGRHPSLLLTPSFQATCAQKLMVRKIWIFPIFTFHLPQYIQYFACRKLDLKGRFSDSKKDQALCDNNFNFYTHLTVAFAMAIANRYIT